MLACICHAQPYLTVPAPFLPPALQRVGAPAFKIGQVSGLASPGDGTVWVVHRGERAWNPDGSVANSGAATSGTMEEEAVLAGPVVLQVSRCGGGAANGQLGGWTVGWVDSGMACRLAVCQSWAYLHASEHVNTPHLPNTGLPWCPCLTPHPPQLDQDSGALLQSWGSGQFVMPHMVTLDYDGNLWITGVAACCRLHGFCGQVGCGVCAAEQAACCPT